MDVPRLLPTLYQHDHHHHTFSISFSPLSLSFPSNFFLSFNFLSISLFKFFFSLLKIFLSSNSFSLSLSSFSRSNHCYGIFFLLSILSFDIHPLYLAVQLNEEEWIGGGRKERRKENREREKVKRERERKVSGGGGEGSELFPLSFMYFNTYLKHQILISLLSSLFLSLSFSLSLSIFLPQNQFRTLSSIFCEGGRKRGKKNWTRG